MLYQKKKDKVLLVKLFDRIHNIQTVNAKSPEKAKRILEETLRHFFSLAIYFDKLGHGLCGLDYYIHSLCYQTIFPGVELSIEKNLIPDYYSLPTQ